MMQSELFLHSFDPVVLLDIEDLTILEANPAFYRFTGLTPETVSAQSVLTWIAPSDHEAFMDSLRDVGTRSSAITWEELWKATEDGPASQVMITACKVKLNAFNHQAIQVIIRDMTHERGGKITVHRYIEELHELRQKLDALTTVDEASGVSNRRQLDRQLLIEHSRASRYKEEYAVLLVSVDHFRHYQDRNGVKASNDLLRQIAMIIGRSSRISDFSGRSENDEFALVCPRTNYMTAKIVAERIRQTTEQKPLLYGASQPLGKLTVSIGIASFPYHGTSGPEILSKAAYALELARTRGRNRAEDAGEPTPSPKKRGLFSLFGR